MSAHLMECRRDGSTTAACLVLDTENAITQAIGLVSCNLLKKKKKKQKQIRQVHMSVDEKNGLGKRQVFQK